MHTSTPHRLLTTICLISTSIIIPSVAVAEAGRLDQARREVRGDSSSSSSNDDDDTSSRRRRPRRSTTHLDDLDDRDDERSSSGSSLNLRLIFIPLAPLGTLAWIPWVLLEHVPGRSVFSAAGRFHSFPYRGGAPGHMSLCWPASRFEASNEQEGPPACAVNETDGSTVPPPGQSFSTRVTSEYFAALPDVHRVGFRARLDTSARIGFVFRWHTMIEALPSGDQDQLSMGELSVTLRLAQHEQVEARVGLGWRYLHDDLGTDHGFNYSLAFDIFPVRPLIISVDLDVGNLGYAFVFQGRATVGAIAGPIELFAGYEVLLIGSVPFHGPTGGLRLWL